MPKFRGTVKKNALEGGFWELVGGKGERYQLDGGDAGLRKEGLEVEVEGAVDKGAMGIGMTGPVLKVKSYRKM
jgi:hypothetical protein